MFWIRRIVATTIVLALAGFTAGVAWDTAAASRLPASLPSPDLLGGPERPHHLYFTRGLGLGISDSAKEQIRTRIDMIQLVSEYVTLQQRAPDDFT